MSGPPRRERRSPAGAAQFSDTDNFTGINRIARASFAQVPTSAGDLARLVLIHVWWCNYVRGILLSGAAIGISAEGRT